jgi:hypothetical protein
VLGSRRIIMFTKDLQPVSVRKAVSDALAFVEAQGIDLRSRFDIEALDAVLVSLNDGSEMALIDAENLEHAGSFILDLSTRGLVAMGKSLGADRTFLRATVSMLLVFQRRVSQLHAGQRLHDVRVQAILRFWESLRSHVAHRIDQMRHAYNQRECRYRRRHPRYPLMPDEAEDASGAAACEDLLADRNHDPTLRVLIDEAGALVVAALVARLKPHVLGALRASLCHLDEDTLQATARAHGTSPATLTRARQLMQRVAQGEAEGIPEHARLDLAAAIIEQLRQVA